MSTIGRTMSELNMAKAQSDKREKKSKQRPPGEMLNAQLLALLKGWRACGYDLMNRLEESGLGSYNSGTIYRNLRQMEKMGLVSSMWDTSDEGPAKRMYSLTQAGSIFLSGWITLLETHRSALDNFMNLATASNSDDDGDTEQEDDTHE